MGASQFSVHTSQRILSTIQSSKADSIMQYKQLEEESRNQRFTASDALEVLSRCAGFNEHDHAKFVIGGLRLPSDAIVGLVNVFFESISFETTFMVSLATSLTFRARLEGKSQLDKFDIFNLHEALLTADGHVTLADGTPLRAVEVIPTLLPYEISELDLQIIHCVISLIKKEDQCYGHPIYRNDPELVKAARDAGIIDYSTLYGHEIPLLKQIRGAFIDRYPSLKPPSNQKISDTLTKIGMRKPARRSRISTSS